jgi:pimeloyl-ACP methyl ester carboxylesterase
MPKAFVHGVPETSAVWSALVAELETRGVGDIHLLTPPGFGAPVPQGFEPNQSNYCDWLVAELEALGGNVDLVGHDWGAGHVYGALEARPDLIRSWATDSGGLIHAEYKWHDLAQAFQTPDAGEQAVAAMTGGTPADRAARLIAFGVPAGAADLVAAGQNEEMARCILALYRSAVQPAMANLGKRLADSEKRPGLVFIPTEDHFVGSEAMYAEVATSLGAKTLTLKGLNHWWMFGEGAAIGADALIAHWGAEAGGV